MKQKIETRMAELTALIDKLEIEQRIAIRNSDWMKSKDLNNEMYEAMGRRAGLHEALMMVIYS